MRAAVDWLQRSVQPTSRQGGHSDSLTFPAVLPACGGGLRGLDGSVSGLTGQTPCASDSVGRSHLPTTPTPLGRSSGVPETCIGPLRQGVTKASPSYGGGPGEAPWETPTSVQRLLHNLVRIKGIAYQSVSVLSHRL